MNSPAPHAIPLHDIITDALRYWEPKRIAYNLVLAGVVIGYLAMTWPHFRPAIRWSAFPPLLVLAVLANVCYCAAYLVDLPVQASGFRVRWRPWRGALWMLGTLFAAVLALYWMADEIYPAVGN